MELASVLFWMTLRVAEMQRPRIAETVTVVASDSTIATPRAVTVLDAAALRSSPAATLDDALRSVPGFSLFRRSSSRVANPTTQGATLRGLAASGSSRALVLADTIPLNDPVGGWVYWNRLPSAALDEVSVARGAAGDLHGSDAVGGVIVVDSARHPGMRILAEGGSHESGRLSAYGGRAWGTGTLFGAGEAFTTAGFISVAPESRGSIDTPVASTHGSAHVGAMRTGPWGFWTARAGHFREGRDNGTPAQTNSTDITHASADLGYGPLRARLFAQVQEYEQTFSAVFAGRAAERVTSEQTVRASAVGAAADWRWISPGVDFAFAARHVKAELVDRPFATDNTAGAAPALEPSQATAAVAAQRRWSGSALDVGVGLRTELWQSTLGDPNRHVFFSPRLWMTRRIGAGTKVNVALQSGYRGPTINELYRPFRVGNAVTRANPLLKPEGVRGIEAGLSRYHGRTTVRVLGFWSRVDDAIVNVTLSSSGGAIIRERQNAARIRARGLEFELELRASAALVVTAASAYTDSVFAAGPLDGLRVPQVPRMHHAVGGRGSVGRARWSAEWRFIGDQFDDDRNVFLLEESSLVDARVGWMLTRRVEVFGAVENALDEEQDVGRTPLRTIGLPRTARGGVRWIF